jgi:hypothetical protein
VIAFGIAVVAFVAILIAVAVYDVRAERAHTERERHLRALDRQQRHGHVRKLPRVDFYDQDNDT